MATIVLKLSVFLYYLFAISYGLWSIPAVYFLKVFSEHNFNLALAITYALTLTLLLVTPKYKKTSRTLTLSIFFIVLVAWQQVTPTHEKNWADSVSQLPWATIDNNQVHIHNIRDFVYQTETDYRVQYIDKTYDLSKLNQLDYALSYWDGNKAIAHSIFSFGFENGEHLAVSVEVRNQKGEEYGGFSGLYNQFELIYVLATEKDVLQLRTNFRKEQVYLYPTNTPKQFITSFFSIVIERINSIQKQPEFYNTMTQNCFTSIVKDFQKINGTRNIFDYRIYANGYSDELFYQLGSIKTNLPFSESKQKFHINQYTQAGSYNPLYSKQIRSTVN